MRLGFDRHGTVADLQGALAREARRLFPGIDTDTLPRSVSPEAGQTDPEHRTEAVDDPVFTMSSLSVRQQKELWAAACVRADLLGKP